MKFDILKLAPIGNHNNIFEEKIEEKWWLILEKVRKALTDTLTLKNHFTRFGKFATI